MGTLMVRDDNGIPLPVLRLRPDGAHRLAVTTDSGTIGPFPDEIRVISLYADGPVYLRTGRADVSASQTDHFLPAGLYLDLALGPAGPGRHSHLAAISPSGHCTLYVSERE
ncbi:hypothetical protein [Azospirillum sp. B506]|uniref:hypothetical protein n=1 Tax=Azospirillum sp. B506 TaxID=137721 RepID=UPI000346BB18|nr:hypothetical protein [Azospirillum sp. B506]